mgnify:CR=1 FL=1
MDNAKALGLEYAELLGRMPNVLFQRLDAAHIFADKEGVPNAAPWTRVINIHPFGPSGTRYGTNIEAYFMQLLENITSDAKSLAALITEFTFLR